MPHDQPLTLAAMNDFGNADLLREIVDSMPANMAILDETGTIVFVNAAWVRFAGENGLEHAGSGVGVNYLEVVRASQAHDAHARKVFVCLRELLDGAREEFEVEYPCHSPFEKRWFVVRGRRFESSSGKGVIVSHTDITRLKLATAKVEEERNRYSQILSNLNTGLRLIDPDMTVLWANDHALRLFPDADMVGQPCTDSFSGDTELCEKCVTRGLFGTRNPQAVSQMRSHEGRWLSVYATPILDREGSVTKVLEAITDCTDGHNAELELKENEERYRALFDRSNLPMFLIDPRTGGIVDVNDTAATVYGWPRDTMRSMNIAEINTLEPEQIEQAMERSRRRQQNYFSFQHRHADGEVRDVAIFSGPLTIRGKELLYSTVIDETDRKKAERSLELLKRSVENSPVSIVITDVDGRIEYANPTFTSITGYTVEEVLGQSPSLLKSGKHDPEFYAGLWSTITAGNVWRGEICNQRKNGELYWEQVAIAPVKNEDGRIANYVAVKEDITRLKEFEAHKLKVERIMRHDLKTPLNSILGFPQVLLADDSLTPDQREMIGIIADSGKKMLDHIDQSLVMFQVESGEYTYVPRRLNLCTTLKWLMRRAESILRSKSIVLRVERDGFPLDLEEACPILSDEQLIRPLLSHLFMNAVEASPKGGTVTIALDTKKGLELTIRNTGVVPPSIRSDFFAPYNSVDKATGAGFGTYVAKLMADALGYGLEMRTDDEGDATWLTLSIPENMVQ